MRHHRRRWCDLVEGALCFHRCCCKGAEEPDIPPSCGCVLPGDRARGLGDIGSPEDRSCRLASVLVVTWMPNPREAARAEARDREGVNSCEDSDW
jgi:hypothetical protein